jgi:hypothetical protein
MKFVRRLLRKRNIFWDVQSFGMMDKFQLNTLSSDFFFQFTQSFQPHFGLGVY